MRRVVIDLPDELADIFTFTAVGYRSPTVLVSTKAISLSKSDYIRLSDDGSIAEEAMKDWEVDEK